MTVLDRFNGCAAVFPMVVVSRGRHLLCGRPSALVPSTLRNWLYVWFTLRTPAITIPIRVPPSLGSRSTVGDRVLTIMSVAPG